MTVLWSNFQLLYAIGDIPVGPLDTPQKYLGRLSGLTSFERMPNPIQMWRAVGIPSVGGRTHTEALPMRPTAKARKKNRLEPQMKHSKWRI